MRRLLSLFLLPFLTVLALAQQVKPCGTSVLDRRHIAHTRGERRQESGSVQGESILPLTLLGEKHALVIMVAFPDQPFSENSRQEWQDIICLPGYHDHQAPGSVSDYFYDQSYGQFRILFDVVGPVEAAHPYAYYGKNKHWDIFDDEFDQNDGELVEEACRAVAENVSFSDYDWDGDGRVDMVYILYAGHGEADYYREDSDVIWPHMGTLSVDWVDSYPDGIILQGLTIDQYACSNELAANGLLAGHGTICHEFSHCLGLPDLYDTVSGKTVLGRYDLMDSGNYNGGGWCPPGYSSYERYACGWLTPLPTVSPHGVDSLAPLHMVPDVRIYHQQPADNDYYLVESRVKDSWDRSLPSHGLMAWHVDYDAQAWVENLVNVNGNNRVDRGSLSIIPTVLLKPETELVITSVYDLGPIRIVRYLDGTIKKVFR